MKQLFFIIAFLLATVCIYGQADSNMVEIQTKTTLADTDIIIVSGTDTTYYTITYAALKTLLNALYEPVDANITKDNEAETLTGNWVNTTNPWAEDEVASTMATESEAKTIAWQSKDSSLVEVTLGSGAFIMGTKNGGWDEASYQTVLDSLASLGSWTSAQMIDLISNETGTGVAVFGTSPTITTSIDLPADAINSAGELGTDVVTMDAVDADGDFTSLTGEWKTTGLLSGGIATHTITTDSTIEVNDSYGDIFYVTEAQTITLPAVSVGMSFTFITVGAVQVNINPDDADQFMLDGATYETAGDHIQNTSTTGDIVVITYKDADGWYAMSGSPDGDHWGVP